MDIILDSCRICLGKQNLRSIFETQRDIPIREKIVYCTSVQVFQDDCLPKMICNQCLFYLDIAYIFKIVCEATDKKLRDLQLTKKIGDFDETEYDGTQEYFTCNENEDISGLLNITTSNVKSYSENNHGFKETYPNNAKVDNNSGILVNNNEPVEIKHFIDERNIEVTVLNENFVDTGKSEENIALLLLQEETKNGVTAEPGESVELIASEEIHTDIERDKQNFLKNNFVEDQLKIRDMDSSLFSEIDKQKKNTLVDADYITDKSIFKDSLKDKVGRHIAKKIAGKFPQKVQQNNSYITGEKQRIFENRLKDKVVLKEVSLGLDLGNNRDGMENFEDILEIDLPMVVFEETVVTSNESFPCYTQNIVNQLNESSACKQTNENDKKYINNPLDSSCEKITKSKANKNPKMKLKISPMTLRKGNRKVNVFDDHSKNIKRNLKKKANDRANDITKNTVKGISTKKTQVGFKCDVCNKSFPFRSHLIRHLNMHTGIKRYTCEYCKQKFINNYNLSVHMLKHTGEFPLKCDLCNKGFPNPSLLKRHMISHTGDTNFQCRYCSVKFTQSSSLKLHERMHLHRPSYHCDICYKVFSYTNSLAAHKKLHFSATRFTCDVCLATFSRKSSLIRHMEGHSKSKKIKCTYLKITVT